MKQLSVLLVLSILFVNGYGQTQAKPGPNNLKMATTPPKIDGLKVPKADTLNKVFKPADTTVKEKPVVLQLSEQGFVMLYNAVNNSRLDHTVIVELLQLLEVQYKEQKKK